MSKQIHNLDKDVSLDSSISMLQQTLAKKDFHIVEQTSEKLTDNIWAVSICDKNCPILSTTACGLTKESAIKKALIKFLESITSRFFWADFFLGNELPDDNIVYRTNEKWFVNKEKGIWPYGVLNEELQAFYNPIGELNPSNLIDCISSNPTRGLCCLPFENIRTNKTTYFPINIIDNLYIDNGISSGKNAIEARINAITSVLKNFIQFKIIADGIALPNIPESVLKKYAVVSSSIKSLHAIGYSILFKDASLNGNYPVVMSLLLDQDNQNVSAGFGANLDYEQALLCSIFSLFKNSSSIKQGLDVEAGFDMDEISSPQNLERHYHNTQALTAWKSLGNTSDYTFFDWQNKFPSTDSSKAFELLCNISPLKENEIYITDYNEFERPCCRVIVPRISEIYPVDDLVWENNNAGIKVRDQILNQNKSTADCERLIEDLEDLNLDDEYSVSKLIGMPADHKCIFHDLTVAELILLLALKTQDNERMQEGCEWILHYQKLDQVRLKTYKCINTILQLDEMTNYATVLEKLYPQDILNNALSLIAGEDVFPLISEWQRHRLLIASYKN